MASGTATCGPATLPVLSERCSGYSAGNVPNIHNYLTQPLVEKPKLFPITKQSVDGQNVGKRWNANSQLGLNNILKTPAVNYCPEELGTLKETAVSLLTPLKELKFSFDILHQGSILT